MCASREYIRARNWLAEQLFRSHEKHTRAITREESERLSLDTQHPKIRCDWYLVAQDAIELRGEYKRRLNALRSGMDIDAADACLQQIREINRKAQEKRESAHLIGQIDYSNPFNVSQAGFSEMDARRKLAGL